ncbi:restriction endonuclease subunit S [Variovorax sp. CCNWLW186]|uniref:restriction endonuclease subunit S n=1 Tax=Variovorax sp. CCNWLW186 TaxID=3127473 RepID=UPI003076B296
MNATDVPAVEGQIGVLKTSCVYRGDFDPQENKAVLPEEYERTSCPVTANTLIVSRMNTPDLVGAAGVVRQNHGNLYLPDRLWQVHFHDANPAYAHYWSRTLSYRAQVEAACAGTSSSMQNLGQDAFRSFVFPCPPVPEQNAIATFLDREIAKIDALVVEQQKLIALLKEKRQAIISHAVTKGLDPTVPMKESGVEWLGLVPAHWDFFPMKRDLIFLTSGSRGWADHYSEEGALFIRIGNLTRDDITLDLSDIQRVVVPPGSEGERTGVRPGDVLFSITAYLGSVAVVPANLGLAYVSQHVALARLNKKKLLPEWLAYVAKSIVGKTYLEMQGYGGTKVQLSLDDVANLPVTVPPIREQEAIVQFVRTETAKLEAMTEQAQQATALLQERRTAVISAAVTGKIKVTAD